MHARVLDSRGIYYRVNDFSPGRPTLVFVHGVSGSSSAWKAYEARFQHDYNVLTYDMRGHGQSSKYRRCADYEISHLVDDLHALLNHVAVDTCVLVSHSFGTLVALEFLRTGQARVAGAVLISGDYDVGRRSSARLLEAALAPVRLLERVPFRPRRGAHVDYSCYPDSGDWNVRRMLADIGNTTWRVYWYCTKAAYAVHAESLLPEIHVPVLLVHGRQDTIFPLANSTYMADRIPDAALVIIEDADHIVVLNRPLEVGDAIEEFVHRLSKQTASSGERAQSALLSEAVGRH
jgi:pimeloyl-ACP methyl ester carboxylesterase